MPSHPDRVRRAGLPEGYQFGDAGAYGTPNDPLTRWRPWHVNVAERRASMAYRITQAQLAAERAREGDFLVPHFDADESDDNPPRADDVWDKQPIPERGWNVIEGEQH
jgi:hypothetical protein